ncbi:MAG: protoheme IX farnesyltransferase [Frankiales bacterium]|nr:protoheme IX farnesyltransferase [Frankiales bacterium]
MATTLATVPQHAGAVATARAYVALTKPRIIELLLVTTLPAMFLAAQGLPSLRLTIETLVGGTLAAGSANALNCYLDRDIDAVMRRTSMRPLAVGGETPSVSPRAALVFGLVLGAVSLALLWETTNPLATWLTLAAIVLYVLGYTVGLKRRTSQNIVWGGTAGCMPVLIGYAAVTGTLSWSAVLLFLVVFFWTPPHFWALAMKFRDDYAAAGVPMLPVVASPRRVSVHMVAHSWAMVACSLLLVPVSGAGWVYTVSAAVLGAAFLREVHLLRRRVVRGEDPRSMRLFHLSISYLSLLSLAVVVDVVLHLPL